MGLLASIIILLLIILGIVFLFFKWRFKLASSNEALIITGTRLGDPKKDNRIYKDDEGRYMKVVRGGGHRLKMFQNSTKVDLKSFQLEIETPKVYTSYGVGVYGKAVATIKVADTLEGIVRYAEQFLGKKDEDIHDEVANVLSSNLRAILSKLSVEQINQDRESFNSQVTGIAQDQLDRMGFKITSFGLTDIWDDDDYLENLGRPQAARVKKEADIAEADNKRETEIKEAEVNEEVSKEKYQREMNVADQRKEKEIKESRILAETQREQASADAAYDMEKEDKNLEVEKRKLDIREQQKETDLRIERRERENEVELEKEQVEVRKQQAEADYLAQVREAEALAETKKQEGRAEAQVTREKSQAEVESLRNRAQAMDRYREVILMEKMMDMMPEFARAVSESMSHVESIRILDGGDGEQLKSLPNTVTDMVSNLQESLGQMTGFDLESALNKLSQAKEGKEAPVQLDGDRKEEEDTETNEATEQNHENDEAADKVASTQETDLEQDVEQDAQEEENSEKETVAEGESDQEANEHQNAEDWDAFKARIKETAKDQLKDQVQEQVEENIKDLSPFEYFEKYGKTKDDD